MSILNQLSSQVGDRTEYANRRVAALCLQDPNLIDAIAAGLEGSNAALMGDCAEVLTLVAEQHPEWAAPYAEALAARLSHKNTRVRWEAMHALALIAARTPEVIAPRLSTLGELIQRDASVIVRDYAVDAVGHYAAAGPQAAEAAYPWLVSALSAWNGKHAGHALTGLIHVARHLPDLHPKLAAIADDYARSERAVIRKAAKGLQKALKSLPGSGGS